MQRGLLTTLSGKTLVCFTLILIAGVLFRFYGLTIGFPFEYHVDESFVINKTFEMYKLGILRPPAFDYPSLIFYLLLGGAHVIALFKELTLFDLYVFGRTVSAIFASATLLVVFLIGRRFEGTATGLVAAALYACTVTALREAHYYTTDSVNTFFIALAIYFILRVAMNERARNYLYAGVCLGLATGSKYNGAFLALPYCFAHFARRYSERPSSETRRSRINALLPSAVSSWFIGGAALSLAVFFLTTPYALITRAEFLKDLNKMSRALSHKIVEANHHYIGTVPYWYYIENLLFWAMGPALEIAGLLGVAYALWRHRRQDIVIALWVVIYFVVVGGWLNKAVRYTLPMLPFLAVFAAAMFVHSWKRSIQQRRQRLATLIAICGALTLSATFAYALAYMNIYRQPHSAIQATEWAYANIPAGSTILLEGPTPHERPQIDARQMIFADPRFELIAHHFKFVYLEIPKYIEPQSDTTALRNDLLQTVAQADYIVMSIRWYEGFVDSPQASPVIRDYYRSLRDGQSEFELIKEIAVYPRAFGINLKDDWSELNFRIFDHPKVWVFKRKTPLQITQITPLSPKDRNNCLRSSQSLFSASKESWPPLPPTAAG